MARLLPRLRSRPDKRLGDMRLTLRPPSFEEQRETATLLIWADVPHWMVVDREFREFLNRFDGAHSVTEIVSTTSGIDGQSAALAGHVRDLHDLGILRGPAPEVTRGTEIADALPPIENLSINLTRRCNRRCRFCYNLERLTRGDEGELAADEIVGFLRQAKRLASRKAAVFILGGEPMLASQKLIAVSRSAVALGFQVLVSTNGTDIPTDFLKLARRLGIQVQVSIDGHNREIHDAVRGNGSYDQAVNAVRNLVSAKVYTVLSMVCHEGNLAHIEAYYRFAESLGANEARVIPLKQMGGGARSEVVPVPLGRIIEKITRMLASHPEHLARMGRDCFSILAGSCRLGVRRQSCGTGLQTVLLDADGGLYPCLNTNFPEFAVANVRSPGFDLETVWRTSPVLASVRRETSVETGDSACSGCLVRYWCLGGCHGETFATKGRLSERSPGCADLQKTLIEMMWTLSRRPEWGKPITPACQ